MLKPFACTSATLLAGALLAAAPQVPVQEPQQPIFRGRVETVAVPVTVFDQFDTLVTSLERNDFVVYDNGKKQDITQFSSGLQPIRAVALVDVSASMMPSFDLAMMAAEQFVIRLRGDDKARVGMFNVRIHMSPEFTSDRDALLKWLRQAPPFSNPTRLLDAIDAAITDLSTQDGRRVVMVFTDGCDTASTTAWSRLLQRIYAEDVMVYAVTFKPRIILKPPPERTIGIGSARGGMGGSNSGTQFPCTLDHWLETSNATPMSDFLKVDDPRWTRGVQLVNQLASDTGGGRVLLTPADEVNRLFTQIMRELHYLYLLGFSPQQLDGKIHELKVAVRDRKLLIRSRQRYLAPLPPAQSTTPKR